MWNKLLLYRLLKIITNTEDSCKEAAKYFKCQPKSETGDKLVDYEIVHLQGLLSKKNDNWYLVNGFDEVAIQITSETVGFRTITNLTEPAHVFAAVPIPDPDADFATYVGYDDTCEIPIAMLIASDDIYQMVDVLKTVEEKHRALSEFYFLPMDQKVTAFLFMSNDVFAKNLVRCLGFMASGRIDPYFYSDRNDDLIEQFNDTMKPINKVDMYRVLSFLDVVGDELLLSENSATVHFPPNWLSFLGTHALVEGCSVWSVSEKSLTQTILGEVPNNFFVPTFMLCWTLDPTRQNVMIKDLLKCKAKKKQKVIRTRLIHLLHYGTGFKLKEIHSVLRHLMEGGLTDEELNALLSGNCATVVKSFLLSEYGLGTV